MPTKINLLPAEFVIKEDIKKTGAILRRVVIACAVFFVVTGLFGGVYMFLTQQQISKTKVEVEDLRNAVKNLEPTEQKIFLTRDRIAKGKVIYDKAGIEKSIDKVAKTVELFPVEISLEEARLSPQLSSLQFQSGDSLVASKLLDDLLTSGIFESLSIDSFDFSEMLGYKLRLEFN